MLNNLSKKKFKTELFKMTHAYWVSKFTSKGALHTPK